MGLMLPLLTLLLVHSCFAFDAVPAWVAYGEDLGVPKVHCNSGVKDDGVCWDTLSNANIGFVKLGEVHPRWVFRGCLHKL